MKWIPIIWGWLLFISISTEIAGAFFVNSDRMVNIGVGSAFLCIGAGLAVELVAVTISCLPKQEKK